MAALIEIINYTNKTLKSDKFTDVSVNGLQIEGTAEVSKIAACVDAAMSTAVLATKAKADLLIAHHGIFWSKAIPVIDAHKNLLQHFLKHQLSLAAYHLPLDAHEVYGNNFLLADLLELTQRTKFLEYGGQAIGCIAENTQNHSLDTMKKKLCTLPGASDAMQALAFGPAHPQKVAIISGSGTDALYEHALAGFDTLVTGEAKQFAYHFARDNKLNVIFAGHYATETIGINALVKHLADKFKTEWCFIDHPTGI